LVWYCDSSALLKLVVAEPETAALEDAISTWHLVTSELSVAELARAARRRGVPGLEAARQALVRTDIMALDSEVLWMAAEIEPALLRTLDAIHLASALLLEGDCEGVITYDARMAEAARASGLAVFAPGADG